jgi:hypothetical protein
VLTLSRKRTFIKLACSRYAHSHVDNLVFIIAIILDDEEYEGLN